jgi:NAD(P)-dependent dehydrogenase (short-subunit alcohol dehydrogenase family)
MNIQDNVFIVTGATLGLGATTVDAVATAMEASQRF